jgi:guanylate kinase
VPESEGGGSTFNFMDKIKNKLVIITAPSGAGKTSVTRHLLKSFTEELAFSVSCATRPPRNNEKDKVDYYFISVDTFKNKIQHDDFAEWEMVYEGKYYGTLKSELHRIWKVHKVPLLDVDVKGGIHLQQLFPENSLSLFIEPPSLEELRRRLETRGTESPESLQARINKASSELSLKHKFDHIIMNDQLERACKETEEIVKEFLKPPPQPPKGGLQLLRV